LNTGNANYVNIMLVRFMDPAVESNQNLLLTHATDTNMALLPGHQKFELGNQSGIEFITYTPDCKGIFPWHD